MIQRPQPKVPRNGTGAATKTIWGTSVPTPPAKKPFQGGFRVSDKAKLPPVVRDNYGVTPASKAGKANARLQAIRKRVF